MWPVKNKSQIIYRNNFEVFPRQLDLNISINLTSQQLQIYSIIFQASNFVLMLRYKKQKRNATLHIHASQLIRVLKHNSV